MKLTDKADRNRRAVVLLHDRRARQNARRYSFRGPGCGEVKVLDGDAVSGGSRAAVALRLRRQALVERFTGARP